MISFHRHWSNVLRVGGLVFAGLVSSSAQAGDFQTVYAFQGGGDGVSSFSVIQDASGNLYGTTYAGGDIACGCGTVFKVAPDGTKTTLYAFKGRRDGAYPLAGLMRDGAGNLYGTTNGTTANHGTVFKLDPGGHLLTLHTFKKTFDGKAPLGSLVMDPAGNLYGTTVRGGTVSRGTVYKIAPDGKESVLHSFGGTTRDGDGDSPASALILDRDGNLYGTTGYGGSNNCHEGGCCGTPGCGTVFKVAPDGTTTTLYAFLGGRDGELPVGSLARDGQGNLYGMTKLGGVGAGLGGGVIFELTPDGAKSELYAFQIATGGVPQAGLIIDRRGNLYGTAQGGAYGYGVAFELTFGHKYKVLHDFIDNNDPSANNLTLGADGILFGATRVNTFECPSSCGTAFKIER